MILDFVRSKYQHWVDKRFLKKHHCRSWEQYNHIYDPRINREAENLVDYYVGYTAIVHARYAIVSNLLSWHDPLGASPYELTNWCKEHCKDEFRLDHIRGSFINSKFVMSTDSIHNALQTAEYFMAFNSEKDAMIFKMRWI